MPDFIERKVGDLVVRIDRLLCVGFGDCITEAPQAFELADDGIARFGAGSESVDRDRLIRACEACPVDALSVIAPDGTVIVG